MSTSTIFSAEGIAQSWKGLKLSTELREAIDAFNAVRRQVFESPAPPKVTTKNAETAVTGYAAELAAHAYLSEARLKVQTTLAARIVGLAKAEVEDVIAQLRDEFAAAAASLIEAADVLPEQLDFQSIASDPAKSRAYADAVAAQAKLDQIDQVMASTVLTFGYSVEPVVRWCVPPTLGALRRINAAGAGVGKYLAAAREGSDFRLAAPARALADSKVVTTGDATGTIHFKKASPGFKLA